MFPLRIGAAYDFRKRPPPTASNLDNDRVALALYDRAMDEQQHPPAVDETVPDIELPDSDGKPRRLGEFAAGGFCIVVFYRGHW